MTQGVRCECPYSFMLHIFCLLSEIRQQLKGFFLTSSDSTTSGTVETGHVPGDLGSVDGHVRRERAVLALFNDGGNSDLLLLRLGGGEDSNRFGFQNGVMSE